MTTAGQIINDTFEILLSEGETPSAAMSQSALRFFNRMLDSWSTERLAVYATQDQVLTWPASTASRTVGPSGTLSGLRPIAIDASTYFVSSSGVSYGLSIINQQQYNAIALKTATSTYPQVIWCNDTMPDATITLWPVPTEAITLHLVSVLPLSQPATLATSLSFPPGYERAFVYNLACEIASTYGIEPNPSVQRLAITSKRDIKRQNNPLDLMAMPSHLVQRRGRFNIYAGVGG